ncbi:hypothetical protein [Pedobacter sp. SYSU D00535]|uniref:hypothetical protein n=1 Tax=Pedobacter sp. SYSU D00535 TaxID=2810308 RepID=UPI001A961026|nr:hypothetical protein [Pedobacter sp. SYSU D00535]
MIRKWFFAIPIIISSCGLKQQADELRALERCTYQIVSTDSLFLGSINVSQLAKTNSFEWTLLQELGPAVINQQLPLKGIIALEVTNPGTEKAGINEFEYQVWIKDQQLAAGLVDQTVSVGAGGGKDTISIRIDENIYPIIAKPENQQALSSFVISDSLKTAVITLKIKPALLVGNEKIKYPGFMTVEKELTNKQLKESLHQ